MIYNKDGHAVGIQDCSNALVEHCTINSTGSAVEIWSGTTTIPSIDHTVRWNVIGNTTIKATSGSGIFLSGINAPNSLGKRTGWSAYGNLIIYPEGKGISCNNPDFVRLYKNTIMNIGAEVLAGVERSGRGDQGRCQVLPDAPVALLVGMGQCVARDQGAKAMARNWSRQEKVLT